MEPDNDYHNLHATVTRVLPMNGEASLTAGVAEMNQNDSLIPPPVTQPIRCGAPGLSESRSVFPISNVGWLLAIPIKSRQAHESASPSSVLLLASMEFSTAVRCSRDGRNSWLESQVMLTAQGVGMPDSKLAREITELVRGTLSPLLFHHSSRVYFFGALAGKHRGLRFDPELLYAGAMFHDLGLTPEHSSAEERFEVDGANAARNSFAVTASRKRMSTRFGRQLPCTPRPEFLNTCTL